jgi:hypothetical protein
MLTRWNGWIRGAFWGAVALTALWALHPRPSAQFDDGATVIRLMAPEGPVGDAMEGCPAGIRISQPPAP